MTRLVAGVDGCRSGWIAVFVDADKLGVATVSLVQRFDDILLTDAVLIAVDIPIGLPDFVTRDGRGCDKALRSKLGARQSSVFAVPAREAVMQFDYPAACEAAFARSDPPRKVSKQCFFLFPKIREVDAALQSSSQDRVFECHPEGAFWAMNGQEALTESKKLKSRPFAPGMSLRRSLLTRAGFSADFLVSAQFRAADAGEDDFLDACACAWTAARRLRDEAICFPADSQVDGRGLRMEIWA
ncbi:MAG: DUF429 domain-containing protein [Hyphomicrobiales bacterium]|nr:DUF429 domain-containing protein [Hyphomicrobiales bacterium]